MARIRKMKSSDRISAPPIDEVPFKWLICVYIRLSKEDARAVSKQAANETQLRSESIKNQKSILTSWIEDYFEPGSYQIVGFFEDDGLTGTDDTRENFMRMIGAIERGEGNCVVVKTLSRAFRNYSDQGYYLEEYFPAKNVRFISMMDSFVDTYADSEALYSLDVPMFGVLNDRFAAATSRSVRKTFDDKRSKGKFIGAFPPWGFLKDPQDKNHLVLDPDTAPIKVQMKDWLLYEGMSLNGVARRLNAMGIPNPTKYKRLKGWNYCNPCMEANDGLWCGTTVNNVIFNLMNIGHMVQGKQRVISYKIHDKVAVPENDWFVVENTHEATFTQEEYDALCALFERDTRTANGSNTVHKFAGLLRCGCCGKAMHRSHAKQYVYFKCGTRKNKSSEACTVKSIRQDRLERAVLGALQAQIRLVESLSDLIHDINDVQIAENHTEQFKQLIRDRERQLHRIQSVYDSLYGDWKLGEITEPEYRRMRDHYQSEMEQLTEIIANIREEIFRSGNRTTSENSLFREIQQYQNITELNRSVLVSLIDVIYVHENNEITIHFRFKDELLRITELLEKNGNDRRTV